jgi:CYTH domain-containing protein
LGVREVIESDIGDREYEQLRSRRDPSRQVIRKVRTCFVWHGLLYELDDITEPVSRACLVLEVQVSDEHDEIDLPDFLVINREVTMEREFANSAIALG